MTDPALGLKASQRWFCRLPIGAFGPLSEGLGRSSCGIDHAHRSFGEVGTSKVQRSIRALICSCHSGYVVCLAS